ncbi:NAD(P)-dependent alcohol dehydrogenase [Aquibacillus rhizosphaerae]|uniref:NAD(P)-dependent alcohol dehydrogenase n=1 Tax=Aquibacillus rhizosphaerae TaxID=3051431 RepID=UPI002F40A60B
MISQVKWRVGKDVKHFKPGDDVFGDSAESGFGAFAEYVSVPEEYLAPKPMNLTYEEAAIVPTAAVTALQGLRDKGKIQARQKVLINGASGGVGIFAIQIAKSFGAEVTSVCSTRNIDLVRSVGTDYVIDHTKEDFTQSSKKYDLIVAVNGYHPISKYKQALTANGTYVMVGGSGKQMTQALLLGPWMSRFGNKKLCNLLQRPKKEDLVFLKELLEAGEIQPVMDKSYTLEEVPEAFKHIDQGHVKGKNAITIK